MKQAFIYFLICCILETVACVCLIFGFFSSCFESGEIKISVYIMVFSLIPMQLCDTVFVIGMFPLSSMGLDPLAATYNFVMAVFCILCVLALGPIGFMYCGNPKQLMVIVAGCLALPAGVVHFLNGMWIKNSMGAEEKMWPLKRDS